MIKTKAVGMRVLHDGGGRDAIAELSRFRGEFYSCLTRRGDALFELSYAVLCADGPVRSLVELSVAGEHHRRGHGGLYAAPARGRIDADRMRQALAAVRARPAGIVRQALGCGPAPGRW
ncbi:hypothetical protein GCM10010440_26690 [Kitasatospora cinereorecta]